MRAINPDLLAAFQQGTIRPFVAAALTFRSKTEYVWSGRGNLLIDGNTFLGVGTMGRIATVTEGTDIRADGTSIGLAGIDPELFDECMNDIQQGLPAKLYAGALTDSGMLAGQPYMFFSGYIDEPEFEIDVDALTITLNLENLMAELQRAAMLRSTSADQALLYPDDSSMDSVETLSDAPLIWGPR